MLQYLLRRLLLSLPVLLGILLITFWLMHLVPGSPWSRNTGVRILNQSRTDPKYMERLDQYFGLDQPAWRQLQRYFLFDRTTEGEWICGLVCGNLGPSYRQRGRSVQEILFDAPEGHTWVDSRFFYSLRLIGLSFMLSALAGPALGLLAAVYHNRLIDRVLSVFMAAGMAVPNFVTGLLLIILLASGLKLVTVLPDWQRPGDWVLPVVVLAISPAGALARITRQSVLEAQSQDYVRTARAKGASQMRVLLRHVLRNALVPVVTLLGPLVAELLAGSFVIEAMFSFPGFGREYWESLVNQDYTMILGVTLIYAVAILVANLVVDALYGWIDPRTGHQVVQWRGE